MKYSQAPLNALTCTGPGRSTSLNYDSSLSFPPLLEKDFLSGMSKHISRTLGCDIPAKKMLRGICKEILVCETSF